MGSVAYPLLLHPSTTLVVGSVAPLLPHIGLMVYLLIMHRNEMKLSN
jgi:hypothetical protein